MVTKIDASMFDAQGKEIILDADADTSITADTDDQIDIRIAGADDFRFTANNMNVLSGSTLTIDSGATITNSGTATGFGVALANDGDNRVVTGTGSGGLNGEANLSFDGTTLAIAGDVTMTGTTPTLTIGDAGAEDTAIVFDGNAQDFHIGLDDTADSLAIGLGSALGTTDHMVFDATGAVTKPLQPSFQVQSTNDMTNLAVNTTHTVTMDNELFDQNGDFNTTNYTFTAPVTGKYFLSCSIRLDNMDTDTGYYNCSILESSRYLQCGIIDPDDFGSDVSYYTFGGSFVLHMDASDTAKVVMHVDTGGVAQADIKLGNNAVFTGCLLA